MEGLLYFKIHKTTRKGKHLIREVTQALVAREHLFLIVVLVIEHLVHGMGTEHQEGNVDVPTNLEDTTTNMSYLVMGK